jgi:hypothetical protein
LGAGLRLREGDRMSDQIEPFPRLVSQGDGVDSPTDIDALQQTLAAKVLRTRLQLARHRLSRECAPRALRQSEAAGAHDVLCSQRGRIGHRVLARVLPSSEHGASARRIFDELGMAFWSARL